MYYLSGITRERAPSIMTEHNPSGSKKSELIETSRRTFVAGAGVAAMGLLLAACGGKNPKEQSPKNSTENPEVDNTQKESPESKEDKPDGLSNKDDYNKLSNGNQVRYNSYELFVAANEVFANEDVDITEYGQFYYNEKFEAVGDQDTKATPSQVAESIIDRLNVVYKVAQGGNRLDKDVAGGLLDSFTSQKGLEDSLGSFYGQGTKSGSWSKPEKTHDSQDLTKYLGIEASNESSEDDLKFPLKFLEVTHISDACINTRTQQNVFGGKYYELVVKVEDGDKKTTYIQLVVVANRHSIATMKDGSTINHMASVENNPETDAETLANINRINSDLKTRYYYELVSFEENWLGGSEKDFALDFPGSHKDSSSDWPTYEAILPPES